MKNLLLILMSFILFYGKYGDATSDNSPCFYVTKQEDGGSSSHGQDHHHNAENDYVQPPKRYYKNENDILNITLETYINQPEHQLLTHMFQIFLHEIVGYTTVEIKYRDYGWPNLHSSLSNTVNISSTLNIALVQQKIRIVDVEWTQDSVQFENCGQIGFSGRYGWFATRLASKQASDTDAIIDYHWTIFRQSNLKKFQLEKEDFIYIETNQLTIDYNYNHSGHEALFIPDQCKSPVPHEYNNCSVLLAGYKDQISSQVPVQITNLKMNVIIIFLGRNLEAVVQHLYNKYYKQNHTKDKSILFYAFKPSLLTTVIYDEDFLIPVSFPSNCRGVGVGTVGFGDGGSGSYSGMMEGSGSYNQQNYYHQSGGSNIILENNNSIWNGHKNHSSSEEEVDDEDPRLNAISKDNNDDYDEKMYGSFAGFEHNYVKECLYESRRIEKVANANLKNGAKLAYEAAHRFTLTYEEYVNFLKQYYSNLQRVGTTSIANVDDVSKQHKSFVRQESCLWMKANKAIWRHWIPHDSNNKKVTVYIGGIFPITGSYTARGILHAAQMATRAVNNDSTVLQQYDLRLHAYDGQCRSDKVMKSFIDYIRLSTFPQMAGILGPACSDTAEPLAGVAKHFQTVVISYSAEGSSFSDREKFPTFFRTIPENKQFQYVYLRLFQHFGWKRVSTLTEEGNKLAEYVSHLHDLLQENGIQFVANRKFPREKSGRETVSSEPGAQNQYTHGTLNMSQYLQDFKNKKAKIIIGDFYDYNARSIVCDAYHQKMTAQQGYVWFLPTWFQMDWYDTDIRRENEFVPCNTSEMIQALNGSLSLQYAYYAPDNFIMQEKKNVSEWRKEYEKECLSRNSTPSDYAGYAYDAVWTYAFALDKLFKHNDSQNSHITNLHSETTTKLFVKMINETDFMGVSGHIKFVGGPSRVSAIRIVQWIDKKINIVGTFYPTISNVTNEIIDGRLELNDSLIHWFGGNIPDDGSEAPTRCVLETLANSLDVSCEIAIVIANIIGFSILGIILIISFIVIKRRYDQKVQRTEDYLKAFGIDILNAQMSLPQLDRWELPRDRVVINRKLGEGAFGTVYGGEAFFDEKGWVAVAVKTLKTGSSCEAKLDFLSEAEVMKRFEDHRNCVRLPGVCTKEEPVYTIMEFMLYGDLKTYLLARRHLVNEQNFEDSDEISSKRLTSMALDVARALSYLAELKYVHRDLAARNCLVNASRVVKISDFGMTRPMYESDYYRFNRKGMLPVRWMAPESLEMGIFTPASDVYSYGVLLYEIITFGIFPFQGKSNNEVLEFVKRGNTLNIPPGVQPQLENLLRACWNFDVQKRIQSSEIVEFLANNPRIVSPSLDIPLASVTLEERHDLEFKPPPSTSTTKPSSNPLVKLPHIGDKKSKKKGVKISEPKINHILQQQGNNSNSITSLNSKYPPITQHQINIPLTNLSHSIATSSNKIPAKSQESSHGLQNSVNSSNNLHHYQHPLQNHIGSGGGEEVMSLQSEVEENTSEDEEYTSFLNPYVDTSRGGCNVPEDGTEKDKLVKDNVPHVSFDGKAESAISNSFYDFEC